MRNIVFVILVMVSFGCSKSGAGYDGDLEPWQAVIQTGEKMDWVFGKNYKPYIPTAGEIDQAEELLSQCFTQQAVPWRNYRKRRKSYMDKLFMQKGR